MQDINQSVYPEPTMVPPNYNVSDDEADNNLSKTIVTRNPDDIMSVDDKMDSDDHDDADADDNTSSNNNNNNNNNMDETWPSDADSMLALVHEQRQQLLRDEADRRSTELMQLTQAMSADARYKSAVDINLIDSDGWHGLPENARVVFGSAQYYTFTLAEMQRRICEFLEVFQPVIPPPDNTISVVVDGTPRTVRNAFFTWHPVQTSFLSLFFLIFPGWPHTDAAAAASGRTVDDTWIRTLLQNGFKCLDIRRFMQPHPDYPDSLCYRVRLYWNAVERTHRARAPNPTIPLEEPLDARRIIEGELRIADIGTAMVPPIGAANTTLPVAGSSATAVATAAIPHQTQLDQFTTTTTSTNGVVQEDGSTKIVAAQAIMAAAKEKGIIFADEERKNYKLRLRAPEAWRRSTKTVRAAVEALERALAAALQETHKDTSSAAGATAASSSFTPALMKKRLTYAQKYLAKRENRHLAQSHHQSNTDSHNDASAMDIDVVETDVNVSEADMDISVDNLSPVAETAEVDGDMDVDILAGTLVGETLHYYDALARLVLQNLPIAEILPDPVWQSVLTRDIAPSRKVGIADTFARGYTELLSDVVARISAPDAKYPPQRRQHICDQHQADHMELLSEVPPAHTKSLITGSSLPAGVSAVHLRLLRHDSTIVRDGWFEPRSRQLVDVIHLAFHFVPQMQTVARSFEGDDTAWQAYCLQRLQVVVLTLARLLCAAAA